MRLSFVLVSVLGRTRLRKNIEVSKARIQDCVTHFTRMFPFAQRRTKRDM